MVRLCLTTAGAAGAGAASAVAAAAAAAADAAADPSRFNYAVAMQETQRWPEALAAYDTVLTLSPSGFGDDPAMLANRGLALLEVGSTRRAEGADSVQRAVVVQPELARHSAIEQALGN